MEPSLGNKRKGAGWSRAVVKVNKVTVYPLASDMYDGVVESVSVPGPDGQECNKPLAVTVALPINTGRMSLFKGSL